MAKTLTCFFPPTTIIVPMSTQPSQCVKAPSPRNFSELWDKALRRYEEESKEDIRNIHNKNAFPSTPSNAEEVMERFDEQNQAFKDFRDHGQKVRGVLTSIVDVVLLLKDGADGASVSPTAYTLAFVAALTEY